MLSLFQSPVDRFIYLLIMILQASRITHLFLLIETNVNPEKFALVFTKSVEIICLPLLNQRSASPSS